MYVCTKTYLQHNPLGGSLLDVHIPWCYGQVLLFAIAKEQSLVYGYLHIHWRWSPMNRDRHRVFLPWCERLRSRGQIDDSAKVDRSVRCYKKKDTVCYRASLLSGWSSTKSPKEMSSSSSSVWLWEGKDGILHTTLFKSFVDKKVSK